MLRRSLLLLVLVLAGCSGDDPTSAGGEMLFGRWSVSGPRFDGVIVSVPAGNNTGRVELEYIYRMRHQVSLDQTGDVVEVTIEHVMSGPETRYVFNPDGSLKERQTGDIVTRGVGTGTLVYSGSHADGTLTLADASGNALTGTLTETTVRLELENPGTLFGSYVRNFYDYESGPAESTPLRDHFQRDPFVIQFER